MCDWLLVHSESSTALGRTRNFSIAPTAVLLKEGWGGGVLNRQPRGDVSGPEPQDSWGWFLLSISSWTRPVGTLPLPLQLLPLPLTVTLLGTSEPRGRREACLSLPYKYAMPNTVLYAHIHIKEYAKGPWIYVGNAILFTCDVLVFRKGEAKSQICSGHCQKCRAGLEA